LSKGGESVRTNAADSNCGFFGLACRWKKPLLGGQDFFGPGFVKFLRKSLLTESNKRLQRKAREVKRIVKARFLSGAGSAVACIYAYYCMLGLWEHPFA
jgi:hypothetical protein